MHVLAIMDDRSTELALPLRTKAGLDVLVCGSLEDLAQYSGSYVEVALVAFGDTGQAMSTVAGLRERIGDIPCVVVTPTPPTHVAGGIVTVDPPVEYDRLAAMLRDAAGGRTGPTEETPDERPSSRSRFLPWSGRVRRSRLTRPPAGDEQRSTTAAPSGDEPRAHAPPTGLPPSQELQSALLSAGRIQELADEVPQVSNRSAVGHLMMDRIWPALHPQAAVLWAPSGIGVLEAVSGRGVPPAVLREQPAVDQPLLRKLSEGEDAIAYTADERYPAYLRGLPGIRGESVLGAALRARDETHGFLIVSGSDFDDTHAAQLRDLLADHAILLGVATHLEILRRRARIDLTLFDQDPLHS